MYFPYVCRLTENILYHFCSVTVWFILLFWFLSCPPPPAFVIPLSGAFKGTFKKRNHANALILRVPSP